MELKDFVSDTLMQIAEGVKDAQSKYKQLGGKINPSGMRVINGDLSWYKDAPMNGDASLISVVRFEVALTSGEKDNNTAGIGVLFGAISIGGKSSGENHTSALTSVKFDIPVCLPKQ